MDDEPVLPEEPEDEEPEDEAPVEEPEPIMAQDDDDEEDDAEEAPADDAFDLTNMVKDDGTVVELDADGNPLLADSSSSRLSIASQIRRRRHRLSSADVARR